MKVLRYCKDFFTVTCCSSCVKTLCFCHIIMTEFTPLLFYSIHDHFIVIHVEFKRYLVENSEMLKTIFIIIFSFWYIWKVDLYFTWYYFRVLPQRDTIYNFVRVQNYYFIMMCITIWLGLLFVISSSDTFYVIFRFIHRNSANVVTREDTIWTRDVIRGTGQIMWKCSGV